jgi:hypothetical protein
VAETDRRLGQSLGSLSQEIDPVLAAEEQAVEPLGLPKCAGSAPGAGDRQCLARLLDRVVRTAKLVQRLGKQQPSSRPADVLWCSA